MDFLSKLMQFFDNHTKAISAMTAFVVAACSIATLVLALIVFLNSKRNDKKTKELIDELRIALIMIATIKGNAEVGKRIYDEYKEKLSENLKKKS